MRSAGCGLRRPKRLPGSPSVGNTLQTAPASAVWEHVYISYFDESGYTGRSGWAEQRVLILGGVLVNTYRAPKTRREWRTLLDELADIAGAPLDELKGRELFRGDGAWRACGHEARAEARTQLLDWLDDRGHKLVVSGVQYDRIDAAAEVCPPAHELNPYVVAGVHAALMIQRSQHSPRDQELNKKLTLLMYDRQDRRLEHRLARLLADPPEWAMAFVHGRCTEDDGLPAILDTAYFADSKQAELIQVADFVSYMIQRKASLDSGAPPSFDAEPDILADVWNRLRPLLIDRRHRFPRGGGDFSRYMEAVSPPALTQL